MGEVGDLAVTTFRSWLDEGRRPVVLDVREDRERDHARIAVPEAAADLHIPLGQLQGRVGEVEAAARAGGPVVVVCHHGQRSMVAATWLARCGVADVHNLDGGTDAWSRRVDPGVPRY